MRSRLQNKKAPVIGGLFSWQEFADDYQTLILLTLYEEMGLTDIVTYSDILQRSGTMNNMKVLDVPFVENPNDRCMPSTIGMVLRYFMPEKQWTFDDFAKLTGYAQGKGTWSAESMINLSRMGFETRWIEDFNHQAFIEDPKGYLRTILDPESFKWQVENSDLELEALRIKGYLDSGNVIEERTGTRDDIKQFLDDGWLVRLEVNANTLADKEGYEGHSVLVIGYDDIDAVIHNPDGANGNKPSQKVHWDLLEKAWKQFGGSYSVYAFRKK